MPWGDDFVVLAFDFGSKGATSAMAPDGSFALGWETVFCCTGARGYDADGQTVGPMWDLTTGLGLASPDPIDVAALANDHFVVVWETYDDLFEPVMHAREFTLDGTPLGAVREVASGADGSSNIHPAVEASPAFSAFLVTWAREDPAAPQNGLDIVIDGFSSEREPQGIFQVNTFDTGDQDSPVLTVGADSRFLVAWRSVGSPGGDVSGTSVQARRFTPNGVPEDDQFQVNSFSNGDQERPDAAMAPDGRFLVVWDGLSAGPDPGLSIQGRIFDPDGIPLGPDFQINTTTDGDQSHPAVEARADGSFLVAWRSPTGVWGQVVDPDGALLGPEVRLNASTSQLYLNTTLAGGRNGRFVVTWETEGVVDTDFVRRARLLRDALFSDGFESGDTSAWSLTVP